MKNYVFALILSILLVSCMDQDEIDNVGQNGQSHMQVALIDSPADYDAVLIEVVGFEYKIDTSRTSGREDNDDDDDHDEEEDEEGEGDKDDDEEGSRDSCKVSHDNENGYWVSVSIQPTVYNLLELNNGTEALLADFDLPAGIIRQIRVILSENNSVVIDGDTIPLTAPSAQESGLKLKIDKKIDTGKNYKLVLDFDAAKSVVRTCGRGYILKPVIHVKLYELNDNESSGSVSGIVFPAPDSIPSVAYLIREEDTISTFPEINGYFIFNNLEPGTFDLEIEASDSLNLNPILVNDIVLSKGEHLELDTLRF